MLQVTADPESSANDLMQVILPDPPMCTAILKIANSAFFGLPREIHTIERAVMVLGFDEIRNIILGKAVFNSFKELNGLNKKKIENLWQHSFDCGLAAKILAERVDLSPSEMFLAGLIHDIGKLAMLITFPTLYSHMFVQQQDTLTGQVEQEIELFYIGHDDVAGRILNKWMFPHSLLSAVGYHHRVESAPAPAILASTIQISDILAHLISNQDALPVTAYRKTMQSIRPDIFDIWEKHEFPCDNEEIKIWIELLLESREKDTAIFSIFSA